jgi:hypothetical protein
MTPTWNPVPTAVASLTARYLRRNHLGSIREVNNAAGAVVTRND